ncbi:MAG: radical SAM protein [Anaerovoracaceae bacterium]
MNINQKIITKTKSVCAQCKQPIDAAYIVEEEIVYFSTVCPEHGEVRTKVCGREAYQNWTERQVVNIPPKVALTQGARDECPLHCGTCSEHLQTACCVLIDLTNRCNQHCPYCFAEAEGYGEGQDIPGEPTLEEIEKKYDFLLEIGEERPFNIQLSGGEPTLREDLPQIIKMGREKGFDYIQINSNGKRIAREEGYAQKLKDAGATVIFMQFDGTTKEIYQKLRNEDLLEVKKQAIENCRKAGLPVTIVPTIVPKVNLENIGKMMEFLLENIDIVKGIHFQPVSYFGRHPGEEERVTMFDVMEAIEAQTSYFHQEEFCPITTGHTLCCFYSTYIKDGDKIRCLLSDETRNTGASCCGADPLEVIKKDRDYVLNKWEVAEPEPCGCCCRQEEADQEQGMDFDQFLRYYRQNTFTVTGMAFQDLHNLDAERVKRCRVQQLTEDNKLIPFCAYNSIYRGEEK